MCHDKKGYAMSGSGWLEDFSTNESAGGSREASTRRGLAEDAAEPAREESGAAVGSLKRAAFCPGVAFAPKSCVVRLLILAVQESQNRG